MKRCISYVLGDGSICLNMTRQLDLSNWHWHPSCFLSMASLKMNAILATNGGCSDEIRRATIPPNPQADHQGPREVRLEKQSGFASFWMAGFESACQVNRDGQRLDMIAAVQHDVEAESDYGAVRDAGFRCARDGIRWHLIDRGNRYDFDSLTPIADAADQHGVQVIWNLLHYGWPDDLNVFSPRFVDRFGKFAGAVARFFADRSDATPLYAPVNEISFLSWAASRGAMYPYADGRDAELKRQLVLAAITACEAIWDVDPRARLVYPEPTIHCVPLSAQPDCTQPADAQNESQFEAWDMIAGYKAPELGGNPKYLDILGSNFYHGNQWECPGGERIHWHIKPRDERWMPLHRLLEMIHHRYERPLFVAETSHVGIGRAEWIVEIAEEVRIALEKGVRIEGICLYPILDRHDWDDPDHWHNSGLWDLQLTENGEYERVLNEPYMAGLRKAGDIVGQPIGVNLPDIHAL